MHINDKMLICAIIIAFAVTMGWIFSDLNHQRRYTKARLALVRTQVELDELKHEAVIYRYAERTRGGVGFRWMAE